METKELVEAICKLLSDKKADDIVKINVEDKTVMADWFIVASGRSQTQVKALCDNVEELVEKNGHTVLRREGVTEGRWAVIDIGDVFVHIFNDEQRLFYHLERLWGEGERYEEKD